MVSHDSRRLSQYTAGRTLTLETQSKEDAITSQVHRLMTQLMSRWFQLRPRFYMAPASADMRGQDGRVVKASFFCEIAMVTRGFETRLQILFSKEVHIVRRDGFNHVRDSIMAPASADIFIWRAGWPSG